MHAASTLIPESNALPGRVSLSEVLSALSYALDLTEGATPGHTLRTCLIGMRIAEEIGVPPAQRSALYYALLLKDAGCSSNAARMAALFGTDDQDAKARMKLTDWHLRVRLAVRTATVVARGRPLREKVQRFLGIAREGEVTRGLIAIRCDRGAAIAAQLGFPAETAAAIRALDEHWCGLGYAQGLSGEDIPLLARIANLAQTVEVFFTRSGERAALKVARERSGTWFDPALVKVVQRWRGDARWWRGLASDDVARIVVDAEPQDRVLAVDADGLDGVARAFADIIDAKSPFTYRHSSRVAELARGLAAALGEDADVQRRVYRAGLLHDIGKLGVSNRILDKPDQLDDGEVARMREHPRWTLQIVERVSAFRDLARTAALHHEKLDGSGYPWGVAADGLDRAARVLVVADMYDALVSDRPYRAGLGHAGTMEILERERGAKLCPEVLDAVAQIGTERPEYGAGGFAAAP